MFRCYYHCGHLSIAVECIPEVPTHQPVKYLIHTSLTLCEFFFKDFTLMRLENLHQRLNCLARSTGPSYLWLCWKMKPKCKVSNKSGCCRNFWSRSPMIEHRDKMQSMHMYMTSCCVTSARPWPQCLCSKTTTVLSEWTVPKTMHMNHVHFYCIINKYKL
jgi:hypothetical protein